MGTRWHRHARQPNPRPTGAHRDLLDLDDSDTLFYALDGQHRLMAILGLNELITTGRLHALDENRKQRNRPPLSRDTLITYIQNNIGGDNTSSTNACNASWTSVSA